MPFGISESALIGGAISGGGSILGGIFGNKAAKKAAQQQQAAALQANANIQNAENQYLPTIVAAGQNAGDRVVAQAQSNQGDVNAATGKAAADVTTAAGAANKLLDPYATAGTNAVNTLNAGLVPGGDFNKTPTLSDLTIDPGYAFREQQAEEAAARAAAAGGGVMGGGFAKALNTFSQNNASQEYQNAFNRFEQSTQNRFANLNTVANAGQAASSVQGANLTGAAKYGGDIATQGTEFGANQLFNANQYAGSQNVNAADLTTQNAIDAATKQGALIVGGGNAAAAGTVGGSNSLWNGIAGGTNIFNQALNPAIYRPNYLTYGGGRPSIYSGSPIQNSNGTYSAGAGPSALPSIANYGDEGGY
jgi:hypothetical protein